MKVALLQNKLCIVCKVKQANEPKGDMYQLWKQKRSF